MQHSGMPVRRFTAGRITAFVDRHNTLWEITMAGLALVYLAVAFTIDEGKGAPTVLVGALAVIFLSEFFLRLYDAPSRRRYLREHWLDLVSSFPLVGGLRSVRILRLLRLGAALRLFALAEHEVDAHQRNRQSWWFIGPAIALIWVGAAVAYWSLERGINPNVHTFSDALYWAFITATTVGYGDIAPVTAEGRIVAGVLIFVGIGLVGFASAQLTQRFLHSQQLDPATVLDKLDALEVEVASLRQELRGLIPPESPGA